MDALSTLSLGVALTLLGVSLFGALLLVPIGLPGLWVMLGAGLLYWMLVPTGGIGLVTFCFAALLVVVAEILEFTVSGRYTRKYGGSTRAAWGSIIGGIAGAIVGVPVPVLGSLVGAFIGTFAGAFVGEWLTARDTRGNPARAATGALLGRAMASAIKSAIGVFVAILLFAAAALCGA
jgi:uncharacterized protein YqgC (DUF456 family)